jgi:hypothetical protein
VPPTSNFVHWARTTQLSVHYFPTCYVVFLLAFFLRNFLLKSSFDCDSLSVLNVTSLLDSLYSNIFWKAHILIHVMYLFVVSYSPRSLWMGGSKYLSEDFLFKWIDFVHGLFWNSLYFPTIYQVTTNESFILSWLLELSSWCRDITLKTICRNRPYWQLLFVAVQLLILYFYSIGSKRNRSV